MREYLPGVQDILRVEDLFDGLHNLKLFFGKLHADVTCLCEADTMLSGDRAAERKRVLKYLFNKA